MIYFFKRQIVISSVFVCWTSCFWETDERISWIQSPCAPHKESLMWEALEWCLLQFPCVSLSRSVPDLPWGAIGVASNWYLEIVFVNTMSLHCVFGLKILLSLIVSAELTVFITLCPSHLFLSIWTSSLIVVWKCAVWVFTAWVSSGSPWLTSGAVLFCLSSEGGSAAGPKPTGRFQEIPVQLLLASAMETCSLEETEFNYFAPSSSGDLRACSRPMSFEVYYTSLASSSSCPENLIWSKNQKNKSKWDAIAGCWEKEDFLYFF